MKFKGKVHLNCLQAKLLYNYSLKSEDSKDKGKVRKNFEKLNIRKFNQMKYYWIFKKINYRTSKE